MAEKLKLSDEQLRRRLVAAESALQALREGQVDAILGERERLVVRLAEVERREAHIKQVLRALRKVDQLIVTTDDPQRLIVGACATLTETLGYYKAFVALTDEEGAAATATASSGFDGEFDHIDAHLRQGRFSPSMRRALAQDDLVVIERFAEEFPNCPMVRRLTDRAGLTRRLAFDGRLFGLLFVSVPAAYARDNEEHALFGELVDDLAFALHKIDTERQLSHLERIVTTIPHPVCYISRDYRFQAANDAYVSLFDVPRERMVGRTVAEFFGRDRFDEEIKPRLDRCLSGHALRFEMQFDFPAKGRRWMEMGYYPHRDDDGRVAAVVVHGLDLTERRQAEAALRDSEERYRAVFEQSSEGILLVRDVVIECNRRAAEILGRSREGLIGHSLLEFAPPAQEGGRDTRARYRKVRDKIYVGQPQRSVWRCLREDGSVVEVDVQARAITVGGQAAALLVARDLTELRQAEAEKARLEEQYRQVQKLEAVGRLAGGVAHDFNNMLSVILGNVELAQEQVDPSGPLRASLGEVRKAAERSAELTRQLLAFARKQTVTPRVLDLNETLAGQLNMLHRLIGENIDLTWRPGPDLWPVEIDPGQVAQVLTNLCVNARDAIEGVGAVTIATENVHADKTFRIDPGEVPPGDYVRLTVSDTGAGMDAETRQHAFEPFFTTKASGEGTGLGLSTVYGIVKQNGGYIGVDSEPGRGTTVRIHLPRYLGAAERRGAQEATTPFSRGHETVLFVEDEPSILKLGKIMLEALGYRVLTAATPGEAIALARDHEGRIDLLITDVIMPEMDGRDLAARIGEMHPDVKWLFISGYAADIIAHRGILDKGVHFIQKPFTKHDLAEQVRQALEEED
ncbi:MAG: PAS domain S-box protein [Planctomycetota bacterium]